MNDLWLVECLRTAQEKLASTVELAGRVGGGDVAEAFRLALPGGDSIFMKTHRRAPADFFSTEATGLAWLRDTQTVAIPKVLGVSDSPALLLLEWIDIGRPRAATEEQLGRGLAALHETKGSGFGRPDTRTTGSLMMPNDAQESWVDCMARNRLLPLAKIARDRGSLPDHAIRSLSVLAEKLDTLGVPVENPALLHGDLWAGNRMVDQGGSNWLIDPACYYGHREADLAMMRLFGGYGERCFAAYHEANPLAPGFEGRVALHQIPPLVVHAIKFGGAYVESSVRAIERYI